MAVEHILAVLAVIVFITALVSVTRPMRRQAPPVPPIQPPRRSRVDPIGASYVGTGTDTAIGSPEYLGTATYHAPGARVTPLRPELHRRRHHSDGGYIPSAPVFASSSCDVSSDGGSCGGGGSE